MRFETKAIHSGGEVDSETGAISPPIILSTTFARSAGEPRPGEFSYIRDANPTQDRLEAALAAIDSGAAALAFASGMAAGAAILQSLSPGSHVVFPDDGYYSFRALAGEFFPKWQLSHTFVAMDDPDAVRAALTRATRMLWCETPSNPLMKVADIAVLAEIAHGAGAWLTVDGTFATPALQRPLELGADFVMHSTTKYIGGHSDVQGGAVVFARRDEFHAAVEETRKLLGGVGSPFNSWLVLRGIRSLAARMRVHCENARAVAAFLAEHPHVEAVHYPGLPSHPGHATARRQMSDFGGMMSFLVRGTREEAIAVAAKTRLFVQATSLGGTESLIEHRQSSEGAGSRTAPNLLRLSIGLEHPQDLIDDLAATLAP